MVSLVWFRNTTYLRIGDMPEKHDVDLLGPAGAEGRLNPTEPDPSSTAGTEAGTTEGGLIPSLNPTEPDPSSMAGTESAEGGLVPSLNPTKPDPSSMVEGGLVPSLNPAEPDPSSMATSSMAEGGLVTSLTPTEPVPSSSPFARIWLLNCLTSLQCKRMCWFLLNFLANT